MHLTLSRPVAADRLVVRLRADERWVGDLVFADPAERDAVVAALASVVDPVVEPLELGDVDVLYPEARLA